jgi:hypothetical protein
MNNSYFHKFLNRETFSVRSESSDQEVLVVFEQVRGRVSSSTCLDYITKIDDG